MRRLIVAFGTLLIAGVAALGPARAEPQMLAVIASVEPVPMTCGNGWCAAEVSTFCLQEDKAVPVNGTAYLPAPSSLDRLVLVAVDDSGQAVRVPAAEIATITSSRGYRAAQIRVDRRALIERGLSVPAVEVGPQVSLVPASKMERAADPAVAAEIDLVTGPLRQLAERFVDDAGARADAARLTGRLVNAIPDDRRGDVDDREALWRDAVAGSATAAGSADGAVEMTRHAFERCARTGMTSFRGCLASWHDMYVGPLNRDYWDAAGAGS
ncbi:MAG: hypothetical protein GVY28_01310 [Alphaproteobacteria bacterium]|jgi:hypothetical protein|nr:hypothetical protein [Alphaproteobacteria bacterium]